jgi:manganese/zinc/iron transport system substrate-binding protein
MYYVKTILLSTLTLTIIACSEVTSGSDEADFSQQPIRVVTTIAQITDAVENIGGEHVAVENLMGPGSNPPFHPHVFACAAKQTPSTSIHRPLCTCES